MRLIRSVLIAEHDYGTINRLSCTLFDHILDIAIGTCASAEELSHKVESVSYDTVVVSPLLLPAYRSIQKKKNQLLAPLLVTVCQRDLSMAQAALEGDVFGLIAIPVIPHEATQTVRLALWQNQLLRLLASKERAVVRFQQHMEAFPHDRKAEGEFVHDLNVFDRTFQALQSGMRLLENKENDQSLFDIAVLVEQRARQQALGRLLTLNLDEDSKAEEAP
ncbi:MAG: hypothetical protein H8K03_11730 [Nitrospira sp.]